VYIIIENSDDEPKGGGVFPTTYNTFDEAKAAVINKYKKELNRQIKEIGDKSPLDGLNVPESDTGFTELYIEKGILFYIHKLPVNVLGLKRSPSVKSNTRKRKMKRHTN
jgi:hypothetical protein